MRTLFSISIILMGFAIGLLPAASLAKENIDKNPNTGSEGINKRNDRRSAARTAESCLPATSSEELDINNVRALLHNGGDMWWDLISNPRYEIPKVDNPADAKHSMFASSLWIGGFDGSGQLRIAAQTYRQSGNDFWPGPIRTLDSRRPATTDREFCNNWDRHFKINRAEIDAFRADFADDGNVNLAEYPNVRDWPGTNPDSPEGFEKQLAPYVDVNDDGEYNPSSGDYPDIAPVEGADLPDQAIWWVINDKGDIHTETQGEAIGVEIQMLAFAYATSNEINDMTFYKETVFNRSTNTLQDAFIGQWVDADLGFFSDDFVGCDTVRGLGYCYNGDATDDLPQGYGDNPPAIGVDFFQGPKAPPNNDKDDDDDGVVDEPEGERIPMSKFVYYNNDFSVRGNPSVAQHFYGYLAGFWKNGASIVDDRSGNGNGFPDPGENTEPTDYMFPDFPPQGCQNVSYQPPGQGWSEVANNNNPFDRRFVISAGPFRLEPGTKNDIIIGVPWARDLNAPAQIGSLCELLRVDDIAQRLFDNNFDLLDGPDAPTVTATEFDQEIVLSWEYENPASNNFYEDYSEVDPVLQGSDVDSVFEFEGYKIYQLIDGSVSASELNNPNRARLIAQCDLKNDVSTIVNRTTQQVAGLEDPIITDQVMVEGNNEGLFHTLHVTEDAFAQGTAQDLVNYRDYYFAVVAYAHNDTSSDGKRFLLGDGNFERIKAVPHKTEFENFGTKLNSEYGDGIAVTQKLGMGNGARFTEITDQSVDAILNQPEGQPVEDLTYKAGAGPIEVKVTNPKMVNQNTYQVHVTRDLKLREQLVESEDAKVVDTTKIFADWIVVRVDGSGNVTDTIYKNEYTVSTNREDTLPEPLNGTEKQIPGHGFSVAVEGAVEPGAYEILDDNGLIGGRIEFEDMTEQWLTGLPDQDNFEIFNWIRSGRACEGDNCGSASNVCTDGVCSEEDDVLRDYTKLPIYQAFNLYDPNQNFETILGGTWAPYSLSAFFHVGQDVVGPRLRLNTTNASASNSAASVRHFKKLDSLNNVDIVITPDPSKWSRCLVIESSPAKSLGSGAYPMAPRWAPSMEKSGDQLAPVTDSLSNNIDRTSDQYGYSYFPGYAVDVDRGVRLNIFFAESSWDKQDNGNDMLFNPTANTGSGGKVVGGRHYIYVTDQAYDGCESLGQFRVKNKQPLGVGPAEDTGYRYEFTENGTDTVISMDSIYKHVTWTSIPLLTGEEFEFDTYSEIPTRTKISLRVNQSFTEDTIRGNADAIYEFGTDTLAAELQNQEVAENEGMDLINIVPNPYYGRSGTGRGSYEVSQLDSRVKLTNLPQEATIRIFTLSGQLVRTFNKQSDSPSLEWDLKNADGVPIASGMYLIHVDAKELGEKVLKFYCVMPELDLNAF